MLYITNGDSAGDKIRAIGLLGDVLPWRDILHDGPVPAGHSLPELSRVRGRFLIDRGWAAEMDVRSAFDDRDATLAAWRDHDEVVLWFEHDLYDQLQLCQILAWLADQPPAATRLSLICIGGYPGHPTFKGLGELSVAELATLYPARLPVAPDQLTLARRAWAAFTAPDPRAIEAVIAGDTAALPFLAPSLRRWLEQFPAIGDGLSRSERQVLGIISSGTGSPVDIFLADMAQEDVFFMGDWSLWSLLAELNQGPYPLVSLADGRPFRCPPGYPDGPEFHEQSLALTETGRRVLAGDADHIALNGIDRWLGGVHLEGRSPRWRWDRATRRLLDLVEHESANDLGDTLHG